MDRRQNELVYCGRTGRWHHDPNSSDLRSFLIWLGVAFYMVGGLDSAGTGIAFICLLFLCVLLHEFGHVLTAHRFGIVTPEVVLLPIGGVARMTSIPEKPREELVVALAGPFVSFTIAALLYLVLGKFSVPINTDIQSPELDFVELLPTSICCWHSSI